MQRLTLASSFETALSGVLRVRQVLDIFERHPEERSVSKDEVAEQRHLPATC
jgi:hypothetical protein